SSNSYVARADRCNVQRCSRDIERRTKHGDVNRRQGVGWRALSGDLLRESWNKRRDQTGDEMRHDWTDPTRMRRCRVFHVMKVGAVARIDNSAGTSGINGLTR